MEQLWIRARAPFAAYRPLQAGSLRTSLPVMTYSAAWGLLLNLAGIETRHEPNRTVTDIRPDAPALKLAIGLPGRAPTQGSLYQQAHAYPVGNTSANLAAGCHGAKYHIAPVRRELLVNLDVVIGAQGEPSLLGRIMSGLRGEESSSRYGLPFAGDNNLLFDRIDILDAPPPCAWYLPLRPKDSPLKGSTRLTTEINRTDSSQTKSVLVAPSQETTTPPPDEAWIWTPKNPDV